MGIVTGGPLAGDFLGKVQFQWGGQHQQTTVHTFVSKWPETERFQSLRGSVGLSGHQTQGQDKAGTLSMDEMVEPPSMWRKAR